MKLRIITKNLKAKHVAKLWKKTYTNPKTNFWINILFQNMYTKIISLGNSPTPKQIEDVIGNDSWTTLRCNFCGEDKQSVIEIIKIDKVMKICKECVNDLTNFAEKI